MIDGSFDQEVPSSQETAVAEYSPERIRTGSLVVEKVRRILQMYPQEYEVTVPKQTCRFEGSGNAVNES